MTGGAAGLGVYATRRRLLEDRKTKCALHAPPVENGRGLRACVRDADRGGASPERTFIPRNASGSARVVPGGHVRGCTVVYRAAA